MAVEFIVYSGVCPKFVEAAPVYILIYKVALAKALPELLNCLL